MSNLKKVLALALALAMVMTMFAGASIKAVLDVKDADQFTDAQLDAAGLLQPLGVLAGMGADELGAGTVTRGQMVAFIYRLVNGGDAGIDAYYSKTALYDDVDTEEWYAPYINWAYAAKVAFGYGDDFGPNDKVTGAQAAAMLVRLLGKDASGADYALKAETYSIGFGLDEGIVSKGLYENALARGDMFILLANALMTEVKGTTIAEKVFDLEIIHNVILDDVMQYDTINKKNDYAVFTFHATDAKGPFLKFWSDVLCVEGKADILEDVGCRYTLLVSKSQDANGYRKLYAAYEEDEGAYYTVVTGLVDDDALIFEGKKQNVFYDDKCVFYVDNEVSDKATFEAAYKNGKNWASYKLIDNDGDGKYEFAHIERFTYAQLGVIEVSAKVTAISAKSSTITLTAEDGTNYNVKFGNYWDKDLKAFVSNEEEIKFALGIDQPGYNKFTGISDTFYQFSIVYNADKGTGYVFKVGLSESTSYTGNYGILVAWDDFNNLYKNMAYATFVNEANEYFNAYVATVNEMSSYRWTYDYVMDDGDQADANAISDLENALIYFTDADYSDDVVSFLTANCINANQTYNWLEAFEWKEELTPDSATELTFIDSVWSALTAKEVFDYSKVATYYAARDFGDVNFAAVDDDSWVSKLYDNVVAKGKRVGVYAVFDLEAKDFAEKKFGAGKRTYTKSLAELKVWDAWDNAHESIYVDAASKFDFDNNRLIDGLALTDFEDLMGYYFYPITADEAFYQIEDLPQCVGFIYLDNATIDFDLKGQDTGAEQFQIYMANGFWHLRFWSFMNMMNHKDFGELFDLTITIGKTTYPLLIKNGIWYVEIADGNDPETGIGAHAEEVRLAQIIKGFIDDEFTAKIKALQDELDDKYHDKPYLSKYTLLDASRGVVFAYGKVAFDGTWKDDGLRKYYTGKNDCVDNGDGLYRWVAYDVETFNKLYYAYGDINCDARIGRDGDNWDGHLRLCHDELIYTILPSVDGKGIKNTAKFTTVVKAMKISSDCIELLPYGWMEKAGYELVVFNGFTGAVNTNGWEIELLSLDETGIASEKVYTKVGLAGAEAGDILLVKKDADGVIVSIEVATSNLLGYLDYIPGGFLFQIASGKLIGAGYICGDDIRGNYYEYKVAEGKIVVYINADGEYSNEYDKDFFEKNADVTVFTAGNYVFVKEL